MKTVQFVGRFSLYYFQLWVLCFGFRKLMNRIAAQNARDRKKSYVVDLERKLAELEAKVCVHTKNHFWAT